MIGPTVLTNPLRKQSFSKTLFKTEEFFVWTENILKTRWRHDNHVIEFSSNTNPNWNGRWLFVFASSGVVWTEPESKTG